MLPSTEGKAGVNNENSVSKLNDDLNDEIECEVEKTYRQIRVELHIVDVNDEAKNPCESPSNRYDNPTPEVSGIRRYGLLTRSNIIIVRSIETIIYKKKDY